MKLKQKFETKKHLIRLGVGVLIFNLILGGLAFSSLFGEKKVDIRTKDQKVLGTIRTIPKFDKNFIMSNQTFSSTRAFPDANSIQFFLERSQSSLANYRVENQLASTLIYNASRGISSSKYGISPNLNPGVILAYLEKEQSLVSLKNYNTTADPDKRLKYATGYGCPDTSACDQQYNGFVNQVNWAAYQLQYNYNNTRNSRTLPYNVLNTINTLDGYSVYLTNEATASQYRYTPHVYWGNYNLWKIITANGWGVNEDTFTYAEIDNLNLPLKGTNQNDTQPIVPPVLNEPKITLIQVREPLQKKYSIGDKSEYIKTLQKFLRQEGYYTSTDISGEYTDLTDSSLIRYRLDKGISIKAESPQQVQCVDLINKDYLIGTENTEVSELQKCLQKLGLFNWPLVTGYFGVVTKKGQQAARLSNVNSTKLKANKAIIPGLPERVSTASNNLSDGCESLKNQQFNYGEQSTRVEQLQKCLQDANLFSWSFGLTGYFGPVTQEAYSKWKGKTTFTFDCDDLKAQTWVFGETSDRVKQLQSCMQQAGVFYFSGGNTGYFGNITNTSLKKWRG